MSVDEDQVLQLLDAHGNADQIEQAPSELPDHVDTDNPDHQHLLEKFGLDPADPVSKLSGGDGDSLGGALGKLL